MAHWNLCKAEDNTCVHGESAATCIDGFDNPFRMRYSVYEFYTTHAEYVLPRLKELRDHGLSCPASFIPNKDDTTEAEFHSGFDQWNVVLTKMIIAFEAITNAEDEEPSSFERHSFVDEGLDLFRQYYFNLWD